MAHHHIVMSDWWCEIKAIQLSTEDKKNIENQFKSIFVSSKLGNNWLNITDQYVLFVTMNPDVYKMI